MSVDIVAAHEAQLRTQAMREQEVLEFRARMLAVSESEESARETAAVLLSRGRHTRPTDGTANARGCRFRPKPVNARSNRSPPIPIRSCTCTARSSTLAGTLLRCVRGR